jgi:hypothetical protein
MPLPMLQRLVELSPVLLSVDPAALQAQLERLAAELGLPLRAVTQMACHQPGLMVVRGAQEGALRLAAEQLASELGMEADRRIRWAVRTPVVLRRHPKVVRRRLDKLAALLGLRTPAEAAKLVAHAPQLITDSYSSMEHRLEVRREGGRGFLAHRLEVRRE